jgi:hypothetical protein
LQNEPNFTLLFQILEPLASPQIPFGGAKSVPPLPAFFIDGKFAKLCVARYPGVDGRGWLEAIESMMKAGSASRKTYAEKAREFRAPTCDGYFSNVRDFLATL